MSHTGPPDPFWSPENAQRLAADPETPPKTRASAQLVVGVIDPSGLSDVAPTLRWDPS